MLKKKMLESDEEALEEEAGTNSPAEVGFTQQTTMVPMEERDFDANVDVEEQRTTTTSPLMERRIEDDDTTWMESTNENDIVMGSMYENDVIDSVSFLIRLMMSP
ncbi:hypothetical protein PIB30_001158 [Stylosanthes scabra]|uniref:Uncharacterized protein n=1 Tax=Stylosanthes scabra TaxID=79078 RepID=A0ABU6V2Y0_9FABA|nr:hypothetical protein [Stylosanthes scabra]